MERREVRVARAEDMQELGAALGRGAMAGDRLLLFGPFGAGKTTLIQGLARGLGVTDVVSSPSFVLERQYQGRLLLYHIDLYRLESISAEFEEEIAEHAFGAGVTAIEWPEKLGPDLTVGAIVLRLEPLPDGSRRVRIEDPTGHLLKDIVSIAVPPGAG